MNFIKQSIGSVKKSAMHWMFPNDNPTDHDKYAFMLLDKAEVDLFIEFMENNDVNINVKDFSSSSLLIKAQGMPSYRNDHTKLLTKE